MAPLSSSPKRRALNPALNPTSESMDRISDLPYEILRQILFLLPKKEIAGASVVSKLWCSVSSSHPVVVFDQLAFERYKNVISWDIHKMERDFCNIVDRLGIRESPVDTLKISIWNGEMAQGRVGGSIAYAMERNFKHLVLHHYSRETSPQPGWHYNFPSRFWKYEGLRTLELHGCNFSGSGCSLSNGFGLSLMKICLVDVEIDDRIFHNMISSCPVLEDLAIKSCTGFQVLDVDGPERIRKIDLKLMDSESQIVFINVHGLEVLCYDGNSSKFTEIIQNSLVENIIEMCLVNIEVDNILLPNFPLLEKLELNNCWLDFDFSVSSVHLRTLKLIDCHYANNCIVLDTLCLNQFHFKGHNELNVTWINASDELEIELVLDHFPYISFSDVAKFLCQLGVCKILTIVCAESVWIEPDIFYLERRLTIEQLKMKIMRRYPQERSLMTVFADFLQISQRPAAVSAEVGEENTVDHVKLHFLYKHEVYECEESWCNWRSCLEELKVSQSCSCSCSSSSKT